MFFLIIAILLTLLVVYFLAQFSKISQEQIIEIVIAKGWQNRFAGNDIVEKCETYVRRNQKYHLYSEKKLKNKLKADQKQLDTYRVKEEKYFAGQGIGTFDLLPAFGYRLCAVFGIDIQSDIMRNLVTSCERTGYLELERGQETNGKKNSVIYAHYLLASVSSYIYFGVMAGLVMAMLVAAMGNEMKMVLIVAVAFIGIMAVLGYLPLDAINSKAAKRREEIDLEFPNVVSKMVLLLFSGMNVSKALEQTADSGEGLMYQELSMLVKETNQSVSLETALIHMQNRCENKYLDKFVTIVSKSFGSGNANLAEDLKVLNDECWMEKKHSARRMADKVQTKLFVPTMLMFVGILVVIIVPVMSGFNF